MENLEEQAYVKKHDAIILNFVKSEVLPKYKSAKIFDHGENYSDRYEVAAPYSANKNAFRKCAPYSWGEDDEKKFWEMADKYMREAEELGFLWFPPIFPTIRIYQKKYEKYFGVNL